MSADWGELVVGLRVDVDTLRGTRVGVPQLLKLLAAYDIRASFFFSVGPDNMGRHVRRLVKPRFLFKMLRSKAAGLYGWDILLRGTLWPGPRIGERAADVMRLADQYGHEVGLHAWDHYRWQTRVESMSPEEIRRQIEQGLETLSGILGRPVDCSAAAGWRSTPRALIENCRFGFRYNSDCRGTTVFRPVIGDTECPPQIPVTLPTYDEVIGRNGVDDRNFNEYLLSLINPGQLNVLTIHAEVEGVARAALFEEFLQAARERRVRLVPLGELLPSPERIPLGTVQAGSIPGREGLVCQQAAGAG